MMTGRIDTLRRSPRQRWNRHSYSYAGFRVAIGLLLLVQQVSGTPSFSPTIKEPFSSPTSRPLTFWGDDDNNDTFFRATTNPPISTYQNSLTSSPTKSPTKNPTPSPTPVPTKSPTKNPTLPPTRIPTPSPTPLPSRSPTPLPTRNPTPQPSLSPTSAPTRNPTPAPSRQPTPVPTRNPTSFPTSMPSFDPTNNPTNRPTRKPSAMPTTSPSSEPTKFPTRMPTPKPSTKPSIMDSSGPTEFPTGAPTYTPTYSPTEVPTVSPTFNPTRSPSSSPTNVPSVEPTISPAPSQSPTTSEPSSTPSATPTKRPTNEPSRSPTGAPSSAPSLPLQTDLIVAFMTLTPYLFDEVLQGGPAIVWERVARNHITNNINLLNVEPELLELLVDTDITNQVPPVDVPFGANNGGRNLRFLQQNTKFANNSLIIEFNVQISYRSVGKEHDLDELVFSAWDDDAKKDVYLNRLKAQSSHYRDVDFINVEVEGFIPKPKPIDPDEGSSIAGIAGGAGGGAVLLLLCGFFYFRSRNNTNEGPGSNQTKVTSAEAQRIAAEIQVEHQDEVSTLGDPMFAPGGMLMGNLEKDEGTATVGDDYDYARQYRQNPNPSSTGGSRERVMSEEYTKSSSINSGSMKSKLGRMGESWFEDDASFEQQFALPEERFDVVAPAGKLGMVIDTPNGGSPVVHAIKDTSVLSDRVRVGDRLLSVDGDDCTAMTAMQVSKLISLKSEKPARVLVFARSSIANPTK